VTAADLAAHQVILAGCRRLHLGYSVCPERRRFRQERGFLVAMLWIVDASWSGTRKNYINANGEFSNQQALSKNGVTYILCVLPTTTTRAKGCTVYYEA